MINCLICIEFVNNEEGSALLVRSGSDVTATGTDAASFQWWDALLCFGDTRSHSQLQSGTFVLLIDHSPCFYTLVLRFHQIDMHL